MAMILIVDDSRFQHAFLRNALAPLGHDIRAANNGREALEFLEKETPDCLVADLIMPEMRGVTLLETMRERKMKVPTLVLTADIQHQVRERCLELGALDVLHKPVKPDVIRDAISQALAAASPDPPLGAGAA